MKYLQKYLQQSFTVPAAAKVMPGTCEKCVYGTGEHAPECEIRLSWESLGNDPVHLMYKDLVFYYPAWKGEVSDEFKRRMHALGKRFPE
jgi:hypothetical protein